MRKDFSNTGRSGRSQLLLLQTHWLVAGGGGGHMQSMQHLLLRSGLGSRYTHLQQTQSPCVTLCWIGRPTLTLITLWPQRLLLL